MMRFALLVLALMANKVSADGKYLFLFEAESSFCHAFFSLEVAVIFLHGCHSQ